MIFQCLKSKPKTSWCFQVSAHTVLRPPGDAHSLLYLCTPQATWVRNAEAGSGWHQSCVCKALWLASSPFLMRAWLWARGLGCQGVQDAGSILGPRLQPKLYSKRYSWESGGGVKWKLPGPSGLPLPHYLPRVPVLCLPVPSCYPFVFFVAIVKANLELLL